MLARPERSQHHGRRPSLLQHEAVIEQILFDFLVGTAERRQADQIDIDTVAKVYARCVPSLRQASDGPWQRACAVWSESRTRP